MFAMFVSCSRVRACMRARVRCRAFERPNDRTTNRTTERTTERTHERTHQRTNERANARTNERTTERTHARASPVRHARTQYNVGPRFRVDSLPATPLYYYIGQTGDESTILALLGGGESKSESTRVHSESTRVHSMLLKLGRGVQKRVHTSPHRVHTGPFHASNTRTGRKKVPRLPSLRPNSGQRSAKTSPRGPKRGAKRSQIVLNANASRSPEPEVASTVAVTRALPCVLGVPWCAWACVCGRPFICASPRGAANV